MRLSGVLKLGSEISSNIYNIRLLHQKCPGEVTTLVNGESNSHSNINSEFIVK